MVTDYTDAIRTNMEAKSNDELLRIWNENDRVQWSAAAFGAVESVLRERGVEFEARSAPPSAISSPSAIAAQSRKRRVRFAILLLLILVVIGLAIFLRAGRERRLIAALKGRNPETRISALAGLEQLKDPRVVELLNAALRDSDAKVRRAAAGALMRRKDPRSIDPMIAALGDSDQDVRWLAVYTLREFGERSVLPLIRSLTDNNPQLRGYAVLTLGEIKDPRSVDPLIAALKDENQDVRDKAVLALGEIKDPRSVDPLIATLNDVYRFVRGDAALALAKMGEPAANRLLPALKNRDLALIAKTYLFFIVRAEPGSEDLLVQALNERAGVEMAEDYLNSGNPVLEAAAEKWAIRNGNTVMRIPIGGGRTGRWGSQR